MPQELYKFWIRCRLTYKPFVKAYRYVLAIFPCNIRLVKGLLTNNQSAIYTMGKANAKFIYSLLPQFGDVSEFLILENLSIGKFSDKAIATKLTKQHLIFM